ncbi:DUF2063 domain-containing protein [Sedimentimonas flavescens]|uniref:HvfC/BufC N-terminal domain-containing protein n=1 Tax=Sedimentimonas flavescens TaxID=2851012 RepID=UPI001F1B76D9|nr:DNA-binding domain-containing protein [Sedimentimonas flavescens]
MSAHEAFAQSFRRGIFDGELPQGVTARDPAEAAQRFAVYRNNVLHSLGRALAARFPVIERLVGADFFNAMARVYVEADPPNSPVLFAWGEGFAEFLEGFPPVAALPYLPDVARLEYARGQAYHAADLPALAPADLGALAARADAIRLVLHPSVTLIASGHAIRAIWAANQPGAAPQEIEDRPETALVLRDRKLDVPVWALGPGEAAFARELLGQAPLIRAAEAAATAEPGFDVGPILFRLFAAGAIIGWEDCTC